MEAVSCNIFLAVCISCKFFLAACTSSI
jgi:hypothetical protein